MPSKTQEPEAAATSKEWWGLAVIALPCMLYSMDLTVLNLALPALSARLHPTAAELLWIVDVYGFLVAGSLITMGTLGDRIGRRRLLLIGAALFGGTSVAAAFASSAAMLIATRALLGLAGATLAPSTLSLIRSMFPRSSQRSMAVGIWITSYSVGAAVGPLLGGLILQHFWPGAVFLVGVPAMLLLLLLGPRLLPESRDPAPGRLDLASAALSLVCVLALVFGLKQAAERGPSLPALLALLLGASLGALFVRRQRALAVPLIDLALFERPAFVVALSTYALGAFASFGVFVVLGQYLQLVLRLSPQAAGFWTAPFALAFIVGSLVTPRLAERFGPPLILPAALLLAALGFLVVAGLGPDSGAIPVVGGFVLFSLGLAPVFTLSTDLVVSSAPPERAGAAAALSETGSELGGALGVAVLGSIATVAYRAGLSGHLPASLSAHEAGAAQSTLGAALDIAATLPAVPRAALEGAARGAFTHALTVAADVAAGLCLLLALGSALLLGNRFAAARES